HYAPWRDDPRPLDGLVQGTYAYLGVARFWRQQPHGTRARLRLRCEAEFAWSRHAALETARAIVDEPALSQTGRRFLTAMVSGLAGWQGDQVSPRAEENACEATGEHYLRWRLAHLQPDAMAVTQIARAWAASAPHPPRASEVPVTLIPWTRSLSAHLYRL